MRAEGSCFYWAFKFVQRRPTATLVHAKILVPYDRVHTWHAWVEWRGRVYDEQSANGTWRAADLKDSEEPYMIEEFYLLFRPKEIRHFNKYDAFAALAAYKHWGPWKGRRV